MNSAINSLNINYDDKAATIYRTGALNYTYVCSHCTELFTNISDLLDHIETHFNCTIDQVNRNAVDCETLPLTRSDDGHRVAETTVDADVGDCSSLSELRFKCSLCDENCDSQDDLNHHAIQHSDLRCKFCEVIHNTNAKLLSHLIETHLSVTELVCSVCSENFVCKATFSRHLQDHGNISCASIIEDINLKCENNEEICVELQVEECNVRLLLQCDICASKFDTKNKLTLHMKEVHVPKHDVVKRGMYMCDQCNTNIHGKLLFYAHQYEHLMGGNKFDDMNEVSLLDNLKTFLDTNISYDELSPEKAYGCKICCHLSVKRRKNIETHILQEHVYRLKCQKRAEKRYSCEYCGQKFTLSHNMIVHKRIHTQERPYTCLICNKSFSHSSYMKYHEKVHTGLCTHQCSTCGLSFKSKTKLNMHIKVHSTETTRCPICSKEFKPHRLNVHIKHVHQNEHRPYKCAVCCQAFKTAKTLKTHSYRHSGEKKYECRFHCSERFTSTAGRRGHEKSKHETH